MPGPVIAGHADLENECSSCHRPFRRQEQRDLCLACHDHADVASDIEQGQGFHGGPQAREAKCTACHTEHAGRDAEVTGLDPETFDHDQTDYLLHGLHQTAACSSCHLEGKRYRETPSTCLDCHEKQDVHRGSLGEKCASCHSEKGWSRTEFDHDATKFPLKGGHAEASCVSCHANDRFEATPGDCFSCHRVNDVHAGRFGRECETCHSSHDWKRTKFDHDRKTEFPLRGAHTALACTSCHRSPSREVSTVRTCYACHEADDEHKGRFGSACDDCHGERSWTDDKFNHQDTRFPLRGAHEDVSCAACHPGILGKESLEKDCVGCHLKGDVHVGEEGKDCGACHSESGWNRDVLFDHGLTRFPLLGLHAAAPCEECHASRRFKEAALKCVECHAADDFHERALGPACALCHNPNGWGFWRFDHATQTDFSLDGAHTELRCHQCHRQAVTDAIHLPMECATCHADEDVHLGSYGHGCGRCHSTSAWDQIRQVR